MQTVFKQIMNYETMINLEMLGDGVEYMQETSKVWSNVTFFLSSHSVRVKTWYQTPYKED